MGKCSKPQVNSQVPCYFARAILEQFVNKYYVNIFFHFGEGSISLQPLLLANNVQANAFQALAFFCLSVAQLSLDDEGESI